MKRTLAIVGTPAIAALVLLGGSPAAQAGEQHQHHQQAGRHHGHADCRCHPKPHKPGHVSCKPNCLGHGPKPCPPGKPKPPVHHRPPHRHHPKPPVKPTPPPAHPVPKPPVVHNPTPVVTHHQPHARVRLTSTPTSSSMTALPRTGGMYDLGAYAGFGLLVAGGLLVHLTRYPRRTTKAWKQAQR